MSAQRPRDLDGLLAWLKDECDLPSLADAVRVGGDCDANRSLFSRRSLAPGEAIFRMPLKLCLTSDGRRSPAQASVTTGQQTDGRKEKLKVDPSPVHTVEACALSALTAAVLDEREQGAGSPFFAYLNSLPAHADLEPHLPYCWSDASSSRASPLKGTDVLTGMNELNPVLHDRPGWMLSFATVLSRAIQYEAHTFALVPLLDFANHRSPSEANSTIVFDEGDEGGVGGDRMGGEPQFVLQARRHIPEGDELTICYGPFGNADLIFRYGFALYRNNLNKVKISVEDAIETIARCILADDSEDASLVTTDIAGEVEELQRHAIQNVMAMQSLAIRVKMLQEQLNLPLCALNTISQVLVETHVAAANSFSDGVHDTIFQRRMQAQGQPPILISQDNVPVEGVNGGNAGTFLEKVTPEATKIVMAKNHQVSGPEVAAGLKSIEAGSKKPAVLEIEPSCANSTADNKAPVPAPCIQGKMHSEATPLHEGETQVQKESPSFHQEMVPHNRRTRPLCQAIAPGFFYVRDLQVSPELWRLAVGCSLEEDSLFQEFLLWCADPKLGCLDQTADGASKKRKLFECDGTDEDDGRPQGKTNGIVWVNVLNVGTVFQSGSLNPAECDVRDAAAALLLKILEQRLSPLLCGATTKCARQTPDPESLDGGLPGLLAVHHNRAYEIETLSCVIEIIKGSIS
jgi:hypothetical protein